MCIQMYVYTFFIKVLLDKCSAVETFVSLESITLLVMPNGSIVVSPNHNCFRNQHILHRYIHSVIHIHLGIYINTDTIYIHL